MRENARGNMIFSHRASLAAKRAATQIEMKMVLMGSVEIWTQDGPEALASRCPYRAQEATFIICAVPPAIDSDAAPVSQHKAGNIDCIGRRVF
jgi:hypothetical protein